MLVNWWNDYQLLATSTCKSCGHCRVAYKNISCKIAQQRKKLHSFSLLLLIINSLCLHYFILHLTCYLKVQWRRPETGVLARKDPTVWVCSCTILNNADNFFLSWWKWNLIEPAEVSWECCYFYVLGVSISCNALHLHCLQTTVVDYCDASECTAHRSKAKELHICPFMADVTWVKWLKDLSAQREEFNMLNPKICSCHFDREQISTEHVRDGY